MLAQASGVVNPLFLARLPPAGAGGFPGDVALLGISEGGVAFLGHRDGGGVFGLLGWFWHTPKLANPSSLRKHRPCSTIPGMPNIADSLTDAPGSRQR